MIPMKRLGWRDLLQVLLIIGGLLASAVPMAAQFPSDSTRMVEADGLNTRVITRGLESRAPGQPVIVLMSGAGSPLEQWDPAFLPMANLAPVFAYDRPGMGGSEYDGRSMAPAAVADHLDAVLDALQIGPPYILVGHSWGGPLALHYAGRRATDVVGLVYLDPTDPWDDSRGYYMADDDEEAGRRARALLDAYIEAGVPEAMVAEMEAVVEFQMTPPPRGLPADPRLPTAIVVGPLPAAEFPPGFPAFLTREFAQETGLHRVQRFSAWATSLFDSRLYLDPRAGHFVHQDAPDLVLDAIRWVVESIEAPFSRLEEYVGTYELNPEVRIEIALPTRSLTLQLPGQRALPLAADSADPASDFRLVGVDARVTFTRDDDGTVSGLVLRQAGRDIPAQRVR